MAEKDRFFAPPTRAGRLGMVFAGLWDSRGRAREGQGLMEGSGKAPQAAPLQGRRREKQGAACYATTNAKASEGNSSGLYGLAAEEFFKEEAGEAIGVVADDAVFFEEIVEDDAETELLERGEVDGNGFGALGAVAASDFGGDGLAIGNDPIDNSMADVGLDDAQMIGEGIAGGFARLGHEIGDVDPRSFGFGDGAGNFRNHQIGENAGVERAGTEEDQISLLDSFDGFGKRAHAAGRKAEGLDRRAAGGDAGLAVNGAAVFEFGDKVNVRKCRRKDAAANREHFAADADGFGKIAGDMSERGEEKIAKIVADQTAAGVEAVLEEAAEKRFIFRKGDHAVANVARRENAILAAQAAGAAAVIGDGDDGSKIGDGVFGAGVFAGARNDKFLEAAEQSGEASASAEGYDAEASGERVWFGGGFFHEGVRVRGNGFNNSRK